MVAAKLRVFQLFETRDQNCYRDQSGYKITGTQLTGLSEAVAYGDEASQSTN